jgi:hypothetical protein
MSAETSEPWYMVWGGREDSEVISKHRDIKSLSISVKNVRPTLSIRTGPAKITGSACNTSPDIINQT